jgi:IS30 family transposase
MTTRSKSATPALERRRARREEAVLLRQQGRSAREIASLLGCSAWTVRDDLKAAGAWEPDVVQGRDGKAYPATKAERKKQAAAKRKAKQDEQEVVLEPIVERCAYCNFETVGDVDDARQAFVNHVCDRPPPPAVSALSRPRRRGWRSRK